MHVIVQNTLKEDIFKI